MPVSAAYALVVCIWSFTPLAIVWSNATLTPIAAVGIRMGIAALLGSLLMRLFSLKQSWSGSALKAYMLSTLGVFGGTVLTYLAAQTVPSGVLSVCYAMSPMLSGMLSFIIFKDRSINIIGWLAMVLALTGIFVVFLGGSGSDLEYGIGIYQLFGAVCCFSLSGVLTQHKARGMHPLAITVGALWVSMPLFLIAWWTLDGQMPVLDWSSKSPWAVIFLALFGSLLGFVSYYFILQRLHASTVALVTVVTPLFALMLGAMLNAEILPGRVYWGAFVVLSGLVLYVWREAIRRRFQSQGFACSVTRK
ncbi:DMT family permease [Oleiphilus messinensis]|uniref:DMT family permease n=1 Tax=Oleiphilus messinensis TaxID=141451 RepID=A0A1Y0I447_9GAMM|nr:DMT family transporter [Oleiphilus messinensis]ARU55191.1 DMT family permease [Oleiphilus messinensis]